MCLRFVFLLTMRLAAWLRLSGVRRHGTTQQSRWDYSRLQCFRDCIEDSADVQQRIVD